VIYVDAENVANSLGILIWELVSGSFPFEQSQEIFEGNEAGAIRKFIAKGSLPWMETSPSEPLLIRIVKVVTRCCSIRPNIRPSAADVAHSLLDILELAAVNIDPTPLLDEGVKVSVSEILDKVDKTGTRPVSEKLDEKLTQGLRELVTQSDPTASFLYGSAIWYNLTEADEDLDPLILVAGVDYQKGNYPCT
jgi:hypothetical protein